MRAVIIRDDVVVGVVDLTGKTIDADGRAARGPATYQVFSGDGAIEEVTYEAVIDAPEATRLVASDEAAPGWRMADGELRPPLAVDAPPNVDVYRRAIAAHVEAAAVARGYDSGVSCASYASSTNPAWRAEAEAFVAFRDAVWAKAFALLGAVGAGKRPAPSLADLITELPAIAWPDA